MTKPLLGILGGMGARAGAETVSWIYREAQPIEGESSLLDCMLLSRVSIPPRDLHEHVLQVQAGCQKLADAGCSTVLVNCFSAQPALANFHIDGITFLSLSSELTSKTYPTERYLTALPFRRHLLDHSQTEHIINDDLALQLHAYIQDYKRFNECGVGARAICDAMIANNYTCVALACTELCVDNTLHTELLGAGIISRNPLHDAIRNALDLANK